MPDSNNGRVTMAILQNDIQHLSETMQRRFVEVLKELAEVKECSKDNEMRIREVERKQDKMEGRSNVQDVVLAVATAVGTILGITVKQP